jgi:hypothetical protein
MRVKPTCGNAARRAGRRNAPSTIAAGLGVFEVRLALRRKQLLDMTPFQIGPMFVECGVVMFVAQAIAGA